MSEIILKEGSTPSTPAAGQVSLYAKEGRVFIKNDAGIEIMLTDLQSVYPVGSIYMSVNSENPATTFGFGTWVAWGTGRVPVGIDSGDTDFDTAEETGGEKTHQLTISEMPSHNHTSSGTSRGLSKTVSGSYTVASGTFAITDIISQGGNLAHNNLQPYITCYMWKRTE